MAHAPHASPSYVAVRQPTRRVSTVRALAKKATRKEKEAASSGTAAQTPSLGALAGNSALAVSSRTFLHPVRVSARLTHVIGFGHLWAWWLFAGVGSVSGALPPMAAHRHCAISSQAPSDPSKTNRTSPLPLTAALTVAAMAVVVAAPTRLRSRCAWDRKSVR